MKKQKRGEIWVSAIIYTVVIIVAITLILSVGIPLINSMRDRITFSRARNMMLNIDKNIVDIALEGEGSQRVVPIEVMDGELKVRNNQVVWRFDTVSDIIASRTKMDVGNLMIISNANVKATTHESAGGGSFILQTELGGTSNRRGDDFIINISKIGSENDWDYISTSSLINYITYKNTTTNGTFSFSINDNSTSSYGTGYTRLVPSGNNSNLGRARVIAHINSTYAEYDLELTLESYADFLTVKVKNFNKK